MSSADPSLISLRTRQLLSFIRRAKRIPCKLIIASSSRTLKLSKDGTRMHAKPSTEMDAP